MSVFDIRIAKRTPKDSEKYVAYEHRTHVKGYLQTFLKKGLENSAAVQTLVQIYLNGPGFLGDSFQENPADDCARSVLLENQLDTGGYEILKLVDAIPLSKLRYIEEDAHFVERFIHLSIPKGTEWQKNGTTYRAAEGKSMSIADWIELRRPACMANLYDIAIVHPKYIGSFADTAMIVDLALAESAMHDSVS